VIKNQSKEKVLEILRQIVIDALMVDPAQIVPEAKIYDDLGAESIDLVDMRFQIEQKLGLNIDPEEMFKSLGDNIDEYDFGERFTVGWFAEFIESKLNEAEEV
jgi:acyl carrier protein